MPAEEPAEEDEAPLGSEEAVEEPVEEEVCGAVPGVWLGEPVLVLGLLPEPLELEEDDEEDEEGEEEPEDDGDPPADGMPPDELLDEVAQPAVTSSTHAVASVAARCRCPVTTAVTRSMAVTPSGGSDSRLQDKPKPLRSCPLRVSIECGPAKLNGT